MHILSTRRGGIAAVLFVFWASHAGGDETRKLDPPRATPPYRRLEIKKVGDVNVVALVDRTIRKDQDVYELGKELDRFIAKKRAPDILLDLRAVEFLADSAMGKLLMFQKRVKTNAGQVKLCSLHSDIAKLFKVTRLDRVFEIHDNQAAGLKAFETAQPAHAKSRAK